MYALRHRNRHFLQLFIMLMCECAVIICEYYVKMRNFGGLEPQECNQQYPQEAFL